MSEDPVNVTGMTNESGSTKTSAWVGLRELAAEIGVRNPADIGRQLEALNLRADRKPTARAYDLGAALDVPGVGRDSGEAYVTYKWNPSIVLPMLKANQHRPAQALEQRVEALETAFRRLRDTGEFSEL